MASIVRGKAKKFSELIKRRFKLDLKKINNVCEKLNIQLLSNTNPKTLPDYICILSRDDYDIGLQFSECDETKESYFLSPEDYEVYSEYTEGGL